MTTEVDHVKHLRTYIVQCVLTTNQDSQSSAALGTLITEGRAPAKKAAKTLACQRMIDQIQVLGLAASSLPPPTANADPSSSAQLTASASRRLREHKRQVLTKEEKANVDYGQQMNPVSRLIQVQQARAQHAPRFRFVRETGNARMKEFVVEVRKVKHSAAILRRYSSASSSARAAGRTSGWRSAPPPSTCSPSWATVGRCPFRPGPC